MDELKPCPCGKTPTRLHVTDAGQGGKWAWATGDCCGEWHLEFRTDYEPLGSDECADYAIERWNRAERAAPTAAPAPTDERAAFEALVLNTPILRLHAFDGDKEITVDRDANGIYWNKAFQIMWDYAQAARAAPVTALPPPPTERAE